MESRLHSVISVVLALFFVGLCIVQLGDPDPVTWILIYGYMVVLLMLNVWKKLPKVASALPMIAAIVGAVMLWPVESQAAATHLESRSAFEWTRESLGLSLCAIACVYVLVRSWLRKAENPWVME